MPLSITVGLSRKRSENFNSEGVSISMAAELDQGLLARPGQLQEEVDGLYALAREALERASEPVEHPARSFGRSSVKSGTNGRNGRRVHGVSARNTSGGGRLRTSSQVRALHALANRLEIDLEERVQEECGCGIDALGIREASGLIDAMKAEAQEVRA